MRLFLNMKWILLAVFLAGNCIGVGDSPRQYKNLDDDLIGKLLRELGPDTLNILLQDPTSANLDDRGFSNTELLTLVNGLSDDRLVAVIKGLDNTPVTTRQEGIDRGVRRGRRAVRLIQAIRRHGCNYASDRSVAAPYYATAPLAAMTGSGLDNDAGVTTLTLPAEMEAACPLSRFDYLDYSIDALNLIQDADKLIQLLSPTAIYRDDAGAVLVPAGGYGDGGLYLETVAYLLVYLNDNVKLSQIVNGVTDARDVAYTISRYTRTVVEPLLDPGSTPMTAYCGANLCPAAVPTDNAGTAIEFLPKEFADLVAVEAIQLKRLMAVIKLVADGTKLPPLLDGRRTIAGPDADQDDSQESYVRENLVPILQGANCGLDNVPSGDDFPFAPVPVAYCALAPDDSDEWIQRLVYIIDEVPNVQRLRALTTQISAPSVPNLVETVAKVDDEGGVLGATLQGYYSTTVCADGAGGDDIALDTTNPTNSLQTLVYVVNNVTDQTKTITLLDTADPDALVQVLDETSYTSVRNDTNGCDLTATGQKLGRIINDLTNTAPAGPFIRNGIQILADVTGNVDNPRKVAFLINYLTITNSARLAAVINATWDSVPLLELLYQVNPISVPLPVAPTPPGPYPNPAPNVAPPSVVNSIRTIAYTIDNLIQPTKLADLVNQVAPNLLADLLNRVANGSQQNDLGGPDLDAAAKKLVKMVNLLDEPDDLTYILANVNSIDNVAALINAMRIGNENLADPQALTTGTGQLALLINAVTGQCSDTQYFDRVTCTNNGQTWFEFCSDPAFTSRAACLAGGETWSGNDTNNDGTTDPFDGTPGNRNSASGMGKLVNILDYVPAAYASNLADMLNSEGVPDADPQKQFYIYKLAQLLRDVRNSSHVVALLNQVFRSGDATDELILIQVINRLILGNQIKVMGDVIDTLPAPRELAYASPVAFDGPISVATDPRENSASVAIHDYILISDLIGNYTQGGAGAPITPGTITGGAGADNSALLIANMSPADGADADLFADTAQRLTYLIRNLNPTINYRATPISRREALVRLLRVDLSNPGGFNPNRFTLIATNYDFPGIGPIHTGGSILSTISNVNSLITLLHTVGLEDALMTIGCLDRVGDSSPADGAWDGATSNQPNFEAPCRALEADPNNTGSIIWND